MFDDVRPTLEKLRKTGLRLAVISNWDERLRPLLDRLNLTPFFETIIVSMEAGFAKPAPQIFERAISSLTLPPASILHVGDSPTEDLAGAQSAGMRAILLDRNASPSPRTPINHPSSIQTLATLLDLAGVPPER